MPIIGGQGRGTAREACRTCPPLVVLLNKGSHLSTIELNLIRFWVIH